MVNDNRKGDQDRIVELHVGQRHTLRITDIAFGGEGVGRIGGFVVFVPYVLVGEEVEIELTGIKRQFARARLIEVRKPSAARVAPRCRHYGLCGGCQYQHIAYKEQLRLKHNQVRELLRRVGRLRDIDVLPVMACPEPFGYRNRLMIRSQWNKIEQRLVIGFLQHDSRLVVEVEECAIAEPVLNTELKKARLCPPPRGGLKVVLRTIPDGWRVPADSFFQTNRFMLPELAGTIRNCIRESGVRYLVDIYCGVGFFAIELANEVSRFIGIECDHRAIAAARENAAMRGISNGEFVAGLAEERVPGLLADLDGDQTAIVLDPPRVGCDPRVLAQIQAMRPVQVLYVSCHPATLARDLNALCEKSIYRIVRVQPLDMFPQTQHIECVVDLRLDEGSGCTAESTADPAGVQETKNQTGLAKVV